MVAGWRDTPAVGQLGDNSLKRWLFGVNDVLSEARTDGPGLAHRPGADVLAPDRHCTVRPAAYVDASIQPAPFGAALAAWL
jgi:hypothetical protein